jgi:hypothetical protein
MEKRHSQFVPKDIVEQVQDLVNQACTLLYPYVTPLTPAQRHELPKMGNKTLSFVEKSYDFAKQNPNLCPPFLDMCAFNADFDDAHNLFTLNNSTLQLHEFIDDTAMLAGSESYEAALVFYNSVKMAARQDIPGAKAIYEELKKRFVRSRHRVYDGESDSFEAGAANND